MNRRGFFKRFSGAVAGAVVAMHLEFPSLMGIPFETPVDLDVFAAEMRAVYTEDIVKQLNDLSLFKLIRSKEHIALEAGVVVRILAPPSPPSSLHAILPT